MSGDLKTRAEAAERLRDDVGEYLYGGATMRDFYAACTPDAILGLYEEIDRLRNLLQRGALPIRWERSQGYDLDAIRAHAQTTETYKHGDTLLMLVNEGDYLGRVIWESEVAQMLSPTPTTDEVRT